MLRPRYIMLGGFLGAGKTTAMLSLARRLSDRGMRVGLITNDQSVGLVDTQMLQANGHATEEISGGCFCCKFDSLLDAAERLTETTRPDVLLAEPVGSCTDLRATVSDPLQQLYGDRVLVAPLSVLVDPLRAQRILGLAPGKRFTDRVNYIYEKQLEEADWVVLNKLDLLSPHEIDALETAIRQRWPDKSVFRVSLRENRGVDEWLEAILTEEMVHHNPIEINYDDYAEGEARLAWLNLTAHLRGGEFNGNQVLIQFAESVRDWFDGEVGEIAHLKMTLMPDRGSDLAVVNVVRDASQPELAYRLVEPLERGDLTVNLRAEGDPTVLSQVVERILTQMAQAYGLEVDMRQLNAFRPGRPVPVHRWS